MERLSQAFPRITELIQSKKILVKGNGFQDDNFTAFQKAINPLIFWGQLWGLNPVLGYSNNEVSKIRFKLCSFIFVYSIIVLTAQSFISVMGLARLFMDPTVNRFAFISFYGFTIITTLLFIRVAKKWPHLAMELAKCELQEYVDSKLTFRCKCVYAVFFVIASVEHILATISNITIVLDCTPWHLSPIDVFRMYTQMGFLCIFDFMPYYDFTSILLQFLVFVCTANWNYVDIFLIIVSMYLTSIFREINKKIVAAQEQNLPPHFWSALREDFTRATKLVREFDKVFSMIIFVSFANSLFFICLQIFRYSREGSKTSVNKNCVNYPSGPLGGYELSIYYGFSLIFIVVRALVVILFTAGIHTASIAVVPSLYEVSASVYCSEIQRFIDQINGDTVALTGLKFFNVTKSLVLSVAGTILTYELVLLQFDIETKD